MNWDDKATEYLNQEDYENLRLYYEELLNQDTENIDHYLLLGVAYLLEGKQEEAQGSWFLLFSQGDDQQIEQWNNQLNDILEATIEQLEKNKKFHRAYALRLYLKDIVPDNLDNILKLILLEYSLDKFSIEHLEEWNLRDLLKFNDREIKDYILFIDSLLVIAKFSSEQVVQLIKLFLNSDRKQLTKSDFIELLSDKLRVFNPTLSCDLAKICLEVNPNNLSSLLYLITHNSEQSEALKFANILYEKADSLGLKTFTNYLLLLNLVEMHQWESVNPIIDRHKLLLNQCIDSQIAPRFIEDNIILVNNVLPYLQDKPEENNSLKYPVSRLFQEEVQSQSQIKFTEYALNSQPHQSNRKLKIGYIASTLRRHSVGWLSRWLFPHHNREKFEIYVYLINSQGDELTQKWIFPYVNKVYKWQDSWQLFKYQDVAQQIYENQIDILVDLDSYTNNLTCQVVALKPAPIQVTWLGSDTSGLPSIDYFIADNYVLPDNAQNYYQEKIWRLPNTYLAVNGFEVAVPTIRKQDLNIPDNSIVYLNVQNAKKLNPHCLSLQMKIIKGVKNSYLLVKNAGDKTGIKNLYLTIASQENVSESRIIFLDRDKTEEEHRANLQIADVVLDTYPYNGSTTTLEALWLGLPVVTRVGKQFAARNSYTYLMNVGITEGIAGNDAEYIEWGLKLGNDANLRRQIFNKLRKSRHSSPLWNVKKFTQEMETAYQAMWQDRYSRIEN